MLADQFKTAQNQFDRLGHPGNITEVYKYTGGQVDFTGSMYGYGAIRVITPGGATASLSGGGDIPSDHVDTGGHIHPLSISQLYGGTASEIYVFKVQGTI